MSEKSEASQNIADADARFDKRLESIEASLNELYKKTQRPGGFTTDAGEISERKSATEMCIIKHALDVPKIKTTEYVPGSAYVDEAITARRALRALIRHGDMNKLDDLERKSLSSFSFGTNQHLLPPEFSNQILSCLVDPSDLSDLVNRVTISAGSVHFLIDNARMGLEGWACESSCFTNNPQPDLQAGLGEVEIKAE